MEPSRTTMFATAYFAFALVLMALAALSQQGCDNDPVVNANVRLHLKFPDADLPLTTKSLIVLSRASGGGDSPCASRLYEPWTLSMFDFGTVLPYPLDDTRPYNSPAPNGPQELFVYTYTQPVGTLCTMDADCDEGNSCSRSIGLELKSCSSDPSGGQALEPTSGGCTQLNVLEDANNDATINLTTRIPE